MVKFQRIVSTLFSLLGLKNSKWGTEVIPNEAVLYRRIHFQFVIKDIQQDVNYKANPSAFVDYELSCDWNKYSTPQKSLELIGRERNVKGELKNINDFFICSIAVKEILDNDLNQVVRHDPKQNIPEKDGDPNNRAHSLIVGDKDKEDIERVKVRLWLSKMSKWEIFDEDRYEQLIKQRAEKSGKKKK